MWVNHTKCEYFRTNVDGSGCATPLDPWVHHTLNVLLRDNTGMSNDSKKRPETQGRWRADSISYKSDGSEPEAHADITATVYTQSKGQLTGMILTPSQFMSYH